ncbi:MAG: L-seryl-tRNA(Sec) selenium transferase [Blastocatellia bacterium]|nr:L-seryl-tRNA(Sec) selenium transferase [Blastocatellia bacterium]
MENPRAADRAADLRLLPSTDDVMNAPVIRDMLSSIGLRRLTSLARTAIESIRREVYENGQTAYSKENLLAAACKRVNDLWLSRRETRLRKVINATGVVIHTNLGRAPLSDTAIQAIRDAAAYCNLEYEVVSGKRGKRGSYVEDLLTELTGAEAALVVNNCAAAALLVLSVFGAGGEVIVSRGELVEIGGDFRIPDVLTQSGAVLKEIGTTNRTKLSDYEKAIGPNTQLVLRVHPSNYRIVGFTETPSLAALADLAHRREILLYEDAGSGALIDLGQFGLDEPMISSSLADGADIVTFSGDKLLGGVQAGLIVGRRSLIEQLRKHPLYRALRVDKLIYAALEATLESYLRGDEGETVPVLRMLGMTRDEIEERSRHFVDSLRTTMNSAGDVEIISGESVIGGGAAPGVRRETALVALRHSIRSAADIEQRLRSADTPVIARIENDRVLIDLRTVHESEERELIEIVGSALR